MVNGLWCVMMRNHHGEVIGCVSADEPFDVALAIMIKRNKTRGGWLYYTVDAF